MSREELRARLEEKIHQMAGLIFKETGSHGLLKIKLSDDASRAIGIAGEVEYATAAGPVLIIGGPEAASPFAGIDRGVAVDESRWVDPFPTPRHQRLQRAARSRRSPRTGPAPSGRYRFDSARRRPGTSENEAGISGWIDTGNGSDFPGPCACGGECRGYWAVPPNSLQERAELSATPTIVNNDSPSF